MGQKAVDPVRHSRLFLFIKETLINDFLYVVIFFVDDLLLIGTADNMEQINGMVLFNLLITLQHLDSMPPHVVHLPVLLPQRLLHLTNQALQPGLISDHHTLRPLLVVMDHRMHQHVQTAALSGGNRHHRNMPQHLRQTVKIDLHPPLLHDIHHVKS